MKSPIKPVKEPTNFNSSPLSVIITEGEVLFCGGRLWEDHKMFEGQNFQWIIGILLVAIVVLLWVILRRLSTFQQMIIKMFDHDHIPKNKGEYITYQQIDEELKKKEEREKWSKEFEKRDEKRRLEKAERERREREIDKGPWVKKMKEKMRERVKKTE